MTKLESCAPQRTCRKIRKNTVKECAMVAALRHSISTPITVSLGCNHRFSMPLATADCFRLCTIGNSNPCLSARFQQLTGLPVELPSNKRNFSLNYHPHYRGVGRAHLLAQRTAVGVHCGFDVGVAHQVLLNSERRSVATHPSAIGMAERVPANFAEAAPFARGDNVIALDCVQ